VLTKELQHASELPGAGQSPMARFKMFTQLGKGRRQAPVAIHGRVIEVGRLQSERCQVMQRIQDLLTVGIRAFVPGNEHAVTEDFDVIDVGSYGDRGEGVPPRHAIAVLLPGDCLVLVDLAGLADCGFERSRWQRQGAGRLAGEACADRFVVTSYRPLPIPLAARQQIDIQLPQVLHARDRRRPLALEQLHPVLDVRLLIAASRQAEEGFEVVVAGQRLPALIELTLPAPQETGRYGLRIIPPQLPGNATEKGKSRDRAVKNGLGLLARQRDGERGVGPGPGHKQDRDLSLAFREVDPDVAEVTFGALAWLVRQGQERLALSSAPGRHVPPHLVVAADVPFFVAQPPVQLRRRVTLLARCLFVGGKDTIDPLLVRLGEHPSRPWPRERVGPRLGLHEHFTDLSPGMPEGSGDLPDAHTIAMSPTYPAVILHRQHP
jgi:hypothetical protein